MSLEELQDLVESEQVLAKEAQELAASVDPVDELCQAFSEAGEEPPPPPSPPPLPPNATLEERLYARTKRELVLRMTMHCRNIRHMRRAAADARHRKQANKTESKLSLARDRKLPM